MTSIDERAQSLAHDFLGLLPPKLAAELAKVGTSNVHKTTASFTGTQAQRPVKLEEITQWNLSELSTGLLTIKNISLGWIVELSRVFDIDPSFFADHALSPTADTPWNAVFPHGSFEKRKADADAIESGLLDESAKFWHVDGVIEYCTQDREATVQNEIYPDNVFPRLLGYDKVYGWNASVRFSYHMVRSKLHILLVDSPPAFLRSQAGQEYNKLWLPLSKNRGGVMLPALYGSNGVTMLDTFDSFGSHAWHIRAIGGLTQMGVSLTPALCFYFVITSTWQTNLRTLTQDIEQVAFRDIRRPDILINDRLHDYRQYLTYLRAQVTMTKDWIPRRVNEHISRLKQTLPASEYVGEPQVRLEQILFQASNTDGFLMDSFQLLMSSMSVLDAQRSLKQVSRAQKVTTLAFVYVPLSFVTGIFGMNIAEINGSPLSIWVPVVVLVITSMCTLLVFSWQRLIGGSRMRSEVPKRQ